MQFLRLIIFSCCMFSLAGLVLFMQLQNFFSAPYVPSNMRKVWEVFRHLKVGPHTKLVDLGSGDGSTVLIASQLGAQATGVEINPALNLVARIRKILRNRNGARFKTKSIFKENLSQYNVVYLYLFPELVSKLVPKLQTELKPGSIIISNTFSIPEIVDWKTEDYGKMHIYTVPHHS